MSRQDTDLNCGREESRWWYMDADTRVLHIRLDRPSHDDPVDWGQFTELGYISLGYHESSPIPTDAVANLQVRGVRELARQVAVMVRGTPRRGGCEGQGSRPRPGRTK